MTPDPLITWAHPVAPQMHPRARTSLVLGIISILGVICLLPVLMGPLAWYFGAVARRDIEREPTRWAGRSEASAGMICGIIGSALLVAGFARRPPRAGRLHLAAAHRLRQLTRCGRVSA